MIGRIGIGSDRVEVKGDAEGGADLVLAAIALADLAGFVVVTHELFGELPIQIHGGAGQDFFL